MYAIDNRIKRPDSFSIRNTIVIIFHFIIVLFLSFITPLILRHYLVINSLVIEKQLEFTFQTCISDLSGVCSFPEALVLFDEVIKMPNIKRFF